MKLRKKTARENFEKKLKILNLALNISQTNIKKYI